MLKKTNLQIIVVLLIQLFVIKGYASDAISKKEMIIIHDKAITLIKNYENQINKLGNEIADIDKTKSNIELLIDLYVNRKTLVYNDLDPAHSLSEFYEIETYATNLSLWYPDGQTVSVDFGSATASNIIDHGENIYSIDVVVPKKINGNYLNKSVNSNQENLLFRIAFVNENNKPDKFKIAGIRNASGNLKPVDDLDVMEVKSASFKPDAILKIQEYLRSTLKDFNNYLALLGNKDESAEDKEFYKTAIYSLFSDADNVIYNDLVSNAEDKYLGIQDYVQQYATLFPVINNISINTDSATFSKVIKNNDGSFYVNVYVDKFFSAKSKGKSMYRYQNKMIAKITFVQKDQSFSNFKIESFDNLGMNQALSASKTQAQNIKDFSSISKVSRKGLYLSANLNSGFAKILDKNIAELDLTKNYHEWDIKPEISYGGQVRAMYMLNDFVGAETGLGYQFVKTEYAISSKNLKNPSIADSAFIDPNLYTLNPNEDYNKVIQINEYDSAISAHVISLPLNFVAYIGKPGKTSFTFKAGFDVNYLIKPKYSLTNDSKYFIYIPNPAGEVNAHFIFLEIYDDDNILGLYDYTGPNTIYKTDDSFNNFKNLSVSGVLYAGAEIPLGYFLSLNAGVTLKSSLTDLSKSQKDYVDIFGQTEDDLSLIQRHVFEHKPLKIQQYLFEVGVKYKF